MVGVGLEECLESGREKAQAASEDQLAERDMCTWAPGCNRLGQQYQPCQSHKDSGPKESHTGSTPTSEKSSSSGADPEVELVSRAPADSSDSASDSVSDPASGSASGSAD